MSTEFSFPKTERCWSVYIDVEGFSAIYECDVGRALGSLRELISALFSIGSKAYPHSPDRLFINQVGDGFVVSSEFHEESPERPLALAITVMRHMIAKGVATKTAISTGVMADIRGCYPTEVLDVERDGCVPIGDGRMTITCFMGSALISPYKLAETRSGAVLLVDAARFPSASTGAKPICASTSCIDWVHYDLPLVNWIRDRAGLCRIESAAAEFLLKKYISDNRNLPESWISNTLESVNAKL